MRKLKVYSGYLFKEGKQWIVVAAVNNQTELSLLTHESLYRIREWWFLSSNDRKIQLALDNPHEIVWYRERGR